MAEGIVFSILGKIAENLVEPIGRQFGYIFCYNSNIDNLKSEVDQLKKMRLGVQMCVDAGKRNLENVEPHVELWLTSVDEMSEGAEQIVQAKVEVEKGCLYGWCPNLKSRYSLSRKAKKKTMAIVELQTTSKFDRVTYPAPPVGIPSTSMGGFKGLESRISITAEVLRALGDDTISMIGIWGMGGVGKTTMVKEVAEKAKARNLFDEVVMAVVSQNPDLTKIQGDLGELLHLKYDEKTILARAGRLHARLTNEDYNIWIEDLVRYVVGLRLFEDVETVANARNRVYSVVDELKICSLLLAGDEEEFVNLHDVVRDVGIAIASKGDFFGGMKHLNVIGFRDVRLTRLPPSLEFLMNLRTLCLHYCDFSTNLSIIGSLKTLEILRFSNSFLKELPSEIGQLSKLKLLDLRCDSIDGIKIPADVLSNLSKLEELYIGRVNWKTEEFRENASITELNSLSRLKALEILIDAEVLPRDFCFQRLMRFRVGMGRHSRCGFPRYQFKNSLTFLGLEMSMIFETNVNVLLKTTEILNFYEVKGMKKVLMELDVKGFEKLKKLSIKKSDEVEYLIDAMDLVPDSAFVSLESIHLKRMHNLKEICNGNPPLRFLSRLQELILKDLPAMKSLWWASIQPECLGNLRYLRILGVKTIESVFTESIVKGLVQLQELRIDFCDMAKIVAMEGGEDDKGAEKIEFPNLNILKLARLPNLRSFYPKSDNGAIPSLFNQKFKAFHLESPSVQKVKTIDVRKSEKQQENNFHIPTLKHFFNEKVAFPSLESLRLSGTMNLDVRYLTSKVGKTLKMDIV
ncbi:hypothetical protein F0562_017259 [Nyssa sinensis]|uniref:Uncharacterized protein n=1 Tax=Nyssa sinensis TaxID=561372 RepID=A0A5J4ZE76_9ASTE|nr:hypothetical protein F0562_017259 [Nyssa sinensis]